MSVLKKHGRPVTKSPPPPLPVGDGPVRWPNGHLLQSIVTLRLCTVLDARRQEDKWLYYVHWNELNRRMDSWELETSLKESHQDGPFCLAYASSNHPNHSQPSPIP